MSLKTTHQLLGAGAIAVLALTGCGSGGGSSSSATTEAPKKACEQPASDKTTVDHAPQVAWESQHDGAYSLAKSDEYGAAEITDGIGKCYQHSAEGAVVATTNAVNTQIGALLSGDTDLMKRSLAADSIDKDGRQARIDKMVKQIGDSSSDSVKVLKDADMRINGYKVESYSKDTAKIVLRLKGTIAGRTEEAASTYTMHWKDDGWKFDVTDANYVAEDSAAKDTSGYTDWGPSSSGSSSPSASSS